jgi:hypothetical protein
VIVTADYRHDVCVCFSTRCSPYLKANVAERDRLRLRAPKVWKGLPMAKVKYITSPDELPAGQNYVLVMYGNEYAQMRHPLGLTITVARRESKTVSELSFLTAVHTAKRIAKQEGISNIFAYTSSD